MFSPTRRTRRMVPASALDKPADRELPLQLALAWLFICVTPMPEQDVPVAVYSAGFVSDILDIIAREAFEVNPTPASFASLQAETNKLLYWEQKELNRVNERRRQRGQHVHPVFEEAAERQPWLENFQEQFVEVTDGTDLIDAMERLLRIRISEAGDEAPDGPEPLERRSPLGIYFRTFLIALRKLSFHETTALSRQVAEWCGAKQAGMVLDFDRPGSYSVTTNPLTTLEERTETRGAASTSYKDAVATGDYVTAVSSLRQFYDYPAKPGISDGAMFPHALLNLATFYYHTGGLASARDTLDEAIRSARAYEDAACLQRCMSLRHRLVTESDATAWPGAKAPLVKNEPVPLRRLMKSVTPMDDLWSVKAAVDLGEPAPVAFRRVYTALGRTLPHKPDGEEEARVDETLNIADWHVAQAGLWSMMGSDALAEQQEAMALAAPDLEDESYLSIQLARAERASLRGAYDEALASLLDSDTVERLAFPTYRRWTRTVWSVLERQATLALDSDALVIISALRADPASSLRLGPGGPERDVFDPSYKPQSSGIVFAHEHVRTSLRRVDELLASHAPPHLILRDVLAALELAAGLSLWPLYRNGTVLLSEALLAMEGSGSGMAAKAESELEAIWDALLSSADGEAVARAGLVRAKAATVDVLRDEDEQARQRALKFADLAISKAKDVGAREVQIGAGALRSMLAQLNGETVPEVEVPEPNLAERVRCVADIVRLVGVRVSEGWQ